MPNLFDFAMNLIKNNPNIANNPNAQHYIEVIQSGDSKQGEEIANNLCQTMGMTKEEAINQAKKKFGFGLF